MDALGPHGQSVKDETTLRNTSLFSFFNELFPQRELDWTTALKHPVLQHVTLARRLADV